MHDEQASITTTRRSRRWRARSVSTRRLTAALLAGSLLAACTQRATPPKPEEPVASTIDPSEPNVQLPPSKETGDGGRSIAVAEATPGQPAPDRYASVAASLDPAVLSAERVNDLLSTSSSAPSTSAAPAAARTTVGPEPQPTTAPTTVGSTTTAPTAPATVGPATTTPAEPGTTISGLPGLPPDPGEALTLPALDASTASLAPPTPANNAGALQVVQRAPTGAVDAAPYVTVTFNQAMTANPGGTAGDADIPIQIEPAIDGAWRWVGPTTARFQPAETPDDRARRVRAATDYRVTVPASMKSMSGARLGAPQTWTFSTRAVTVVGVTGASATPNDAAAVDRTPVFAIEFDQHVDAQAAADASVVLVGDRRVPMRPATRDEIDAEPEVRDAIDAAGAKRAIGLSTVEKLAPDTDIELRVGPNVASAEGPRRGDSTARYYARTRSTPRLASNTCTVDKCPAGTGLQITLTNPIDTDRQRRAEFAKLITVKPVIEDLTIKVSDDTITVSGATQPNTDYTVTLDGSLTDRFGEPLGESLNVPFSIGDAQPFFDGPRSEMVILDPDAESPTLAVQVINHDRLHVRIWAVTSRDYNTYLELREAVSEQEEVEIPESWRSLFDDTISVEADRNELRIVDIDLDDELDQAGSQLVVAVEPDPALSRDDPMADQNAALFTWVQRTALAVDAIADESNLLIWTTKLGDGSPVGGIPIALIGDSRVATSDEEGLAVIKLTSEPIQGLIANDGKTVTYLPAPSPGWTASDVRQRSRWQVVTNQDRYRPGDTVEVTGWLRSVDPDSARLLSTPSSRTEIVYRATDQSGAVVAQGSAMTNPLGGCRFSMPLADNTAPGLVQFHLAAGALATNVELIVDPRTPPDFGVVVAPLEQSPFLGSLPVTFNATARDTDDAPVANRKIAWTISSSPTTFRPPGWEGFDFGPSFVESAGSSLNGESSPEVARLFETKTKMIDGTTDGTGAHAIAVDTDTSDGFATALTAIAAVDSPGAPAVEAQHRVTVHPAQHYVGLHTERRFSMFGRPITVDAVVAGIDGVSVADRPIVISLHKVVSTWANGGWVRSLQQVDTCELNSVALKPGASATESMRCRFNPEQGGEYRLRGVVTDEEDASSTTEVTHWVSGSLALPSNQVQLETATVVPDRDEYAPGDTAKLLIGAPWAPARGVVVLSRYGIETEIPFETDEGSVIVDVPISEYSAPNVTGWVTIVGSAPRINSAGQVIADAKRPAVASGQINLRVTPTEQRLQVTARPSANIVQPGEQATINVTVTDANGEPVRGAQVAVVAVEASGAELLDDLLPSPADTFLAPVESEVHGISSRQYVQLLNTRRISPTPTEATTDSDIGQSDLDRVPGAGGWPPGPASSAALYSTDNITDGSGEASVGFVLPSTMTDYRIKAIAVAPEQRFGLAEASLTAGDPIEVQIRPPSAVRVGDRFAVPVELRNLTDSGRSIDVAIQAEGATVTSPAGRRIPVPADDGVGIVFELVAGREGGSSLRVVAEATGDQPIRREANTTIDVAPRTERHTRANYVTIDPTANTASVLQPVNGDPTSAPTTATVSTSAMIHLFDVSRAIIDGEPPASIAAEAATVIGAAAMREGPTVDSTDDAVSAGRQAAIAMLQQQRSDGGWPAWPRSDESDPWSSVLAAEAALLAADAGWTTWSDTQRATALAYLGQVNDKIPDGFPASSRALIRAAALTVLSRAGSDADSVSKAAEQLFVDQRADIRPDAAALLWPLVRSESAKSDIAARVAASLAEDPPNVFDTGYGDDDWVTDHSPARSVAIVLRSVLAEAPNTALVQQAFDQLMARRQRDGTWGNTQADAFAAAAIARYAKLRDPREPVTVQARLWWNGRRLDDVSVAAATAGRHVATVTIDEAANPSATLGLAARGAAVLHVRFATLTTRPEQGRRGGLLIERSYESVGEPDAVVRQPDGSWKIAQATPVRVRVVVVTDRRRNNVLLRDVLPGGLYPESPSVALPVAARTTERSTTGAATDQGRDLLGWPGWYWFVYQDLNDTRAEVAASTLEAGTYEYSYLAIASTAGTYFVPPATAVGLYDPATFGASTADTVTVTEPETAPVPDQ